MFQPGQITLLHLFVTGVSVLQLPVCKLPLNSVQNIYINICETQSYWTCESYGKLMRRQACISSQHVVSKPHTFWLSKAKLETGAHLASSPYWAGLLTKSMVHDQTLVACAYLVLFFLNFECWFDLGCFLVSFFVCTYNYILLLFILFYCG